MMGQTKPLWYTSTLLQVIDQGMLFRWEKVLKCLLLVSHLEDSGITATLWQRSQAVWCWYGPGAGSGCNLKTMTQPSCESPWALRWVRESIPSEPRWCCAGESGTASVFVQVAHCLWGTESWQTGWCSTVTTCLQNAKRGSITPNTNDHEGREIFMMIMACQKGRGRHALVCVWVVFSGYRMQSSHVHTQCIGLYGQTLVNIHNMKALICTVLICISSRCWCNVQCTYLPEAITKLCHLTAKLHLRGDKLWLFAKGRHTACWLPIKYIWFWEDIGIKPKVAVTINWIVEPKIL